MDRIPDSITEFAHYVARIPIAKTILKPIYYRIKSYVFSNRKAHFRENALDVLSAFDKCMTENNIEYSLIFGSLLGAIREHGFISHDFDIDVALFISDRNSRNESLLKQYGFFLKKRFMIGDGALGCEETYFYKNTGVSIDIFYICPPIDHLPYVCCWNYGEGCATYRDTMKKYNGVIPRRIELPINHEIIRIDFENIKINIFKNAHQISEYSYGPNYMTPDPQYIAPTEHRVIWSEKLAKYEEF